MKKAFLDFLYPPACLFCGGPEAGNAMVCRRCLDRLRESCLPAFHRGGHGFPRLSGSMFLDYAVTFWEYSKGIENLIHWIKYRRGKRTCLLLGALVAEALSRMHRSAGPEPCSGSPHEDSVLFVPVPLHKVKHRERGYNQSEWICEAMAAAFPLKWDARVLKRHRYTKTQTHLSAWERQDNVGTAFSSADSEMVMGKTVCLVDDVITTGATVNACAGCLLEAGAERVIAMALARPIMD